MAKDLIPTKANQQIVNALQELLDEARDQVVAEHGNVVKDEASLEAEITLRMLELSENHRSVQRVAQGYVVAYVARRQLWQSHPDEYASQGLRQFLRAAGLGESTVSDLTTLGKVVVPFCDHHRIGIDKSLTLEDWPKLREAIPAVRRAIRDGDKEQVRTILDDVKKAATRDAVRVKYRQSRTKLGHGTTLRLGDGRVLLVAILDDDEAASTIVHRMDGAIEWDLVLGSQLIGGSLKVVIDAKAGQEPVA